MKRYLILPFLLGYASCPSFSEDLFETKYTTADVLNVRNRPSLNGQIVFQLPYGSLVTAKKTPGKDTIAGKESYWYYVKEVDAYVLGAYLSDSKPLGAVEFTYYKDDSNEGCPSDHSTLSFSNMHVRQIRTANCHGDSTDEMKEGALRIHPKYLEITWNDYYSTSSTEYGDKKAVRTLVRGGVEKLYWNAIAPGWVTEAAIVAMSKFRCVSGKSGCSVDCSESCVSLNNEKGCKNLVDWTQYVGTGFPYYCKTRSW